jgi:hypothetical protein
MEYSTFSRQTQCPAPPRSHLPRQNEPGRFLTACWIVAMAGLLISTRAQADDNFVVVDDNLTSVVLGAKLDILEDPEGELTLEDVRTGPKAGEFQRSESEKPNFGFTKSAFWVRFELRNVTDRPRHLLLQLDNGILDEITLYQPTESGQWSSLTLGDRFPFENRTVPNRVPVFELELPPNTSEVFYARLITEGSMQIPLVLHDPVTFFNADHTSQIAFGLYTFTTCCSSSGSRCSI